MQKTDDRSVSAVRRVLKGGKFVFNNKQSVADCVVRSLSDTGAGARLEGPITLPDELELLLDGKLLKVRRIWQKGLDVGLEFD